MLTVTAAGRIYIDGRVARGEVTKGTAARVMGVIRRMAESCGDVPVRDLDKGYAEAFMASVAHKMKSTRKFDHSAVNNFAEWMVDEEIIDRNPFRRVKPPKPERRVPRPLGRDQVAACLRAAERADGSRGRLIVLLMVQQGFRCSGVASLRREEVDLAGGWMRLREKGGHEREIPITEECGEALAAYLAEFPCESGPLVRAWMPPGTPGVGARERQASRRGLAASSVSRFVTEWMYLAGVKSSPRDRITPHAFRHTCATDMLEAGADITEVQAMLGHQSVGTTMIYTQVRPARLQRAAAGRRYGVTLAA